MPKGKASKEFFNLNEQGITLQTVILVGVLAIASVGASTVIYNTITDEVADIQEATNVADSAVDIQDFFQDTDEPTQELPLELSAEGTSPENLEDTSPERNYFEDTSPDSHRSLPPPTQEQVQPPEPETASQIEESKIIAISAGETQTCAILGDDKTAYCWGSNWAGQLGDGTYEDKNIPTAVSAPEGQGGFLDDVVSISVGIAHTCAILGDDETAYCWGWDIYGQLGDGGGNEDKNIPTAVSAPEGTDGSLVGVTSISVGWYHTCAIIGDEDTAYCWGWDGYGQVSDGGTYDEGRIIPTAVQSPEGVGGPLIGVTSISAGVTHTCAIVGDENTAYCWGYGHDGQLGGGETTIAVTTPSLVSAGEGMDGNSLVGVSYISSGWYHTCAVVGNDNTAYCWGSDSWGTGQNDLGRLGDGDTNADKYTPNAVSAPEGIDGYLIGVTSISAGVDHTCAIAGSEDTAYCWGNDEFGQLGDGGENTAQNIPVEVSDPEGTTEPSTGVNHIALGSYHTCALMDAGNIYCWGDNRLGQLGDGGTATNIDTPTAIIEPAEFPQISAGDSHTCTIFGDDKA